jgi:hypothetical protein
MAAKKKRAGKVRWETVQERLIVDGYAKGDIYQTALDNFDWYTTLKGRSVSDRGSASSRAAARRALLKACGVR